MLKRAAGSIAVLVSLLALTVLPAVAAGAHRTPRVHRQDRRATTALRVTMLSPVAGEQISGSVRWTASVSGSAPAKVTFAVEGGQTKTVPARGTTSISLDTSRLSVGRHTLSVTAMRDGHSAADRATVTVARRGEAQSPAGGTTGQTAPTGGKGGTVPTRPTPPVVIPKPIETPLTPEAGSGSPGGPESPTGGESPTPAPEEPSPTPAPEEPVIPSASKILWGAWIGEQFTGAQAPWDMNAVSKFEAVTEKPLSLVNFSSPFASCASTSTPTTSCSFYSFPKNEMESIRQHGSIPFFSWASSMLPASTNQPNFQLSDVIEGKFDTYIRNWATAAKNWGHPFFLRFNWEMNGGWFQWSEGVNGNKAGEYVAAWRHVHDIFTSVGATNATWTWCPNVDVEGKLQNLAALYPGDNYVDWTALDGYNWGTDPQRPDKWRTFNSLFASTYRTITEKIAPSKPMVIGEVGSTEYGGSKATWINEMLSELPTRFPKIRGFLWFEKGEEGDWPIESSTASAKAFASGIKSPTYTENTFASLAPAAIQPAA